MLKIRFRDNLVKTFIKGKEISVTEFCEHCGITQYDFDTVMKGENCNLIIILKMGSYMRLQVRHFFEVVKE